MLAIIAVECLRTMVFPSLVRICAEDLASAQGGASRSRDFCSAAGAKITSMIHCVR